MTRVSRAWYVTLHYNQQKHTYTHRITEPSMYTHWEQWLGCKTTLNPIFDFANLAFCMRSDTAQFWEFYSVKSNADIGRVKWMFSVSGIMINVRANHQPTITRLSLLFVTIEITFSEHQLKVQISFGYSISISFPSQIFPPTRIRPRKRQNPLLFNFFSSFMRTRLCCSLRTNTF